MQANPGGISRLDLAIFGRIGYLLPNDAQCPHFPAAPPHQPDLTTDRGKLALRRCGVEVQTAGLGVHDDRVWRLVKRLWNDANARSQRAIDVECGGG